MKQLIVILLIAVTGACQQGSKPAPSTPEPNGRPKFAIQEEIYNFGKVQAGEMVSYSFKFSNQGHAALQITKVETDCGCLHIDYPNEPVKPGDFSYIEVLFNTAGEVGQVLKQISVYTNEEEQPKKLMLTARVENELFNSYK